MRDFYKDYDFKARVTGVKLNDEGEIVCGKKIKAGDEFVCKDGQWSDGFCERMTDGLFESLEADETQRKINVMCPDTVIMFEFEVVEK